jgi:hypothetical protein
MSPWPSHIAMHHPLGVLIVVEKTSSWGDHRRAVGSSAPARGRCAATAPGCTHDALVLGARGPLWSMGWTNSAGCGPHWSPAMCGDWNSFPNILNIQIVSKLWKSIQMCTNVQKLQSKFCVNPLKQIYSVGLTKFVFVYYCIVEITRIQILEYLIRKICKTIKPPNFAYVCTSWSLAYTKFLIFISCSEYFLWFNFCLYSK